MRIFRRNHALIAEWRHLNSHRILLVSVIVMLFIPIMYGGFFLGSIWDPYGNTKNLPVAIVNEDEGAMLNGQKLAIGDDMVRELKNNKDMGWHFVTAKVAASGLGDGSYYMRLTIPRDFSKDASTVGDPKPAKSTLNYTVTPARNYIASLLTRQAAEQIERNVSTTISKAYVSAILHNVKTMSVGLGDASNGANDLAAGSQSLSSGISRYTAGVGTLSDGQVSLNTGLYSLSSGSLALKNGLADLQKGLPKATDIQQLKDGVTNIKAGITMLNGAVQNPSPSLVAQQTLVTTYATSLQQKLSAYSTAAVNANTDIMTLQSAVAQGQTNATVNATTMLALISTSQDVSSEAINLLTNLTSLNSMLSTQQAAVKTNIIALKDGMDTLSPNLLTALGGYTSISNGTSTLLAGATQLYAGTTSAIVGNGQLVNGAATLNSSSLALISGASQVASGSDTLAAALSDASQQLAIQPTGVDTTEQIVNPVAMTRTVKGDVPNYGFALSPYVLSLGLFVGALVFNVIYPVRRFFGKPKNSVSWWAAKVSVSLAVAVGQALVVDAIMVFGLGLRPDNPAQFVLTSIVTSIAYMSVISLLALALDNVGRFIAMVLLVLQLGSAGGVFPIVLSPGFFQAVNPFVPMTYSIYAYREAISSGLGSGVFWGSIGVLTAIIVAANLAIVVFLQRHGMRHFAHESIDE